MNITIDLTAEQINYLRTLVAIDVADRNKNLRSNAFATQYGPTEQQRVIDDIRIGSTVLGVLPARRIECGEFLDKSA